MLDSPHEEPITKTTSDIPSFVRLSIFDANSSDENIFPLISRVITNAGGLMCDSIFSPSCSSIFDVRFASLISIAGISIISIEV